MSRPTLAVIHSLLDKGLCPTRLSVGGDEGEVRGHHRDRQQDLRGDKISDHGTSGINFVSVFSAEIAETEKSLEFEKNGRALTFEKKLNRLYNFFLFTLKKFMFFNSVSIETWSRDGFRKKQKETETTFATKVDQQQKPEMPQAFVFYRVNLFFLNEDALGGGPAEGRVWAGVAGHHSGGAQRQDASERKLVEEDPSERGVRVIKLS